MTRPVVIRTLVRYRQGDGPGQPDQDLVAVESPLTLRIQPPAGAPVSLGILMRTPGDDEDLAVGALLAEGVIQSMADVQRVHVTIAPSGPTGSVGVGDEVVVDVAATARVDAAAGRGSASTSACGLCGRLEVLATDTSTALSTTRETPMVTAECLSAIPDQLRATQAAFDDTGGLHAAGLFEADGTLRLVREDVGRHNAVDKVAGALLRQQAIPAATPVLAVSGRVAYEIVQKAARCGIPVILAVGAPTDLAVDAARSAGITLVGFAREGRFNVYTWPGRVVRNSPQP
ncbi:MAG: formate dehydrogenase accessory sulfurtransferase FdhD [Acidimicrobiia bacterium]|nr:formate dehydrogenase accessory sulfurtransferase FdhD [Acidimicrobiia bacterium]